MEQARLAMNDLESKKASFIQSFLLRALLEDGSQQPFFGINQLRKALK